MMVEYVLRKSYFVLAVVGVLLQLALAANINNTAGEEINGQYLLDMGRKTNDPILQAIGLAIINHRHHRCGDWTSWTSCTAGALGYFGIKGRTRMCGNVTSSEETEKDFSICGTFCPSDFDKTSNGFCVKLHTSRKSYADADSQCQAEGAYLINIDSEAKYKDILNLKEIPSISVYTGGRRNDAHSPWMFEYGNKSGYFKWGPEQPNNTPTALCLVLGGSNKLMYDASCQESRPFICEISM